MLDGKSWRGEGLSITEKLLEKPERKQVSNNNETILRVEDGYKESMRK